MADDEIPDAKPEYLHRFPPFPTAPEGKTIIPFKDFKPMGIRVSMDDDDDDTIERDGLGIPTIPLRVKHTTDDQEKKKRKKKKGGAQQVSVQPEKPKTWWEQWEELEDVRKNHYDLRESRVDRLFKAAYDFKGGRTWPPASSGLFNLWDQYRLYIGLLNQPVIQRKPDAPVSEDEDSDEVPAAPKDTPIIVEERVPLPKIEEAPPFKKRRKLFRGIGAAYDEAEEEEEEAGLSFHEKLGNHREEKDMRMENFLNDPETSMKIFFSSYFRDRGLIWSEHRCLALPILISFFLRYLLRSRVLPEKEHEKPLRRALEVVELARTELPATFTIGRKMADAFSDGCQQCWDSKQPNWIELAALNEAPAPTGSQQPEKSKSKDHEKAKPTDDYKTSERSRGSIEEPDAKRIKFDSAAAQASILSPPVEQALKAAPSSIGASPPSGEDKMRISLDEPPSERIKVDRPDASGLSTQITPPVGTDDLEPVPIKLDQPEDSSFPLLPSIPPLPAQIDEAIKVGAPIIIDGTADAPIIPDGIDASWAGASTWGEAGEGQAWGADWMSETVPGAPDEGPSVFDSPLPSLWPLLGATALPLTHTAGVVEMSTRRIVRVHPPAEPRVLALGVSDAEAVEEELERRFARVVLAPWPVSEGAERSDVTQPIIFPASNGAVVGRGEPAAEPVGGTLKPHDPYRDEITLLVEPQILDILIVGMGLGATWVEILRQDGEKKGKKGKKGKKRERPRYWYMEQLMHQLPSYHTDMPAKSKLP